MNDLEEMIEKIKMTSHSTKDVSSIVFHDDFSIPVYNTIDMSWAEFERKCEKSGRLFSTNWSKYRYLFL